MQKDPKKHSVYKFVLSMRERLVALIQLTLLHKKHVKLSRITGHHRIKTEAFPHKRLREAQSL